MAAGFAMAALSVLPSVAAAADSGCIELRRLDRTKAIDNRTIVATLKGRDQYRRIELSSACAGLKFHDAFGFDTPEPRLCKGESITVMRTGSVCGIADITAISADEARTLLAAR
jgi:hypothetical protein